VPSCETSATHRSPITGTFTPFQRIQFLFFFLFISLCESTIAAAEWQAGAASTIITPEHALFMAGYGSRKTPSEGKRTELFAKALVLDDGAGHRGALISLDLVGIDREFSQAVCKRLERKHGLARNQIALLTSHTHSGPVVGRNLGPLHYWVLDDAQRKLIDAYADVLLEKIVTLVGDAIATLAPARVQSGSGICTFAVNRRNNKPYADVPAHRAAGTLAGPVDHDVPVLSVRDPEGNLRAILFGYACHATVLGLNEWNGDYPGYAQAALEENHPGAIALFWAGCGGDQNPLPRKEIPLAEKYGAELAHAVSDVLKAPMPELEAALATRYTEIDAQRELKSKGAIADKYPYPIGLWTLGNHIDFIHLGGEVVVDYALRLKTERHRSNTWVAGYANDVMAYIPSLRVLKEGGYEGGGSNVYYGLPALWHESIEETIITATHTLGANRPTK
jgi:hypothetical protein